MASAPQDRMAGINSEDTPQNTTATSRTPIVQQPCLAHSSHENISQGLIPQPNLQQLATGSNPSLQPRPQNMMQPSSPEIMTTAGPSHVPMVSATSKTPIVQEPTLAHSSHHENISQGQILQPNLQQLAIGSSPTLQPTVPQNMMQPSSPELMTTAGPLHAPMGYERVDIQGNQNNVKGNQTDIEGGQTNFGPIHGTVNFTPTYNVGYQEQTSVTKLDLNRCQRHLRAIYKTKKKRISFLPGMPKEFNIEDFFVELTLLSEDRNPADVRQKRLAKYTDMLALKDRRGHKEKHVLIRGLAGMGKTTMISRLAYQWATQEFGETNQDPTFNEPSSKLKEFKLVFVLDVRKFKSGMNLADVVRDQLLHNAPKQSLDTWLADNSDQCLFLFDGYDEMKSVTDIFDDPHLLDAHVIVTTRPRKVQEFVTKYEGYIHVRLEGFSQESAAQFILQFFESFKDGSIAIQKYNYMIMRINSSPVLISLTSHPLLLGMMCLLWKQNENLPETITSLYKQAVEYIARHLMEKCAMEQQHSAHQYAQFKESIGLERVLVKLGETALSGLMRNNLVFDEDEFESVDLIDQACSLGLIFKESAVSGFDSVSQISFIHFTFQEFCAAKFLANMADTDHDRFLKFLDTIDRSNVLALEIFLKFCCGVSSKAAEGILSHVVRRVLMPGRNLGESWMYPIGYTTSIWHLPFKFVFEVDSNCEIETATLHSYLQPLTSKFDIVDLLSAHFSHCQEMYTIIESYIVKFRDHSSLRNQTWLAKVEEANFMFNHYDLFNVDAKFVQVSKQLIEIMPNLRALNLHWDMLYHTVSMQDKSICSVYLDISNKIEKLNIDGLCFDMITLLAFLDKQKQLKSLRLDGNAVSHQDMTKLLTALTASPLLSLELCHNPVRHELIFSPELFCHLQDLSLSHAKMDTKNCTQLFEVFIGLGRQLTQQNRSAKLPLRKLDMSWNKIGDAAVKLAEAFQYMGNMNYLDLSVTNLVEKQIREIAQYLHFVSDLEHVALTGCKIGDAMSELLEGLRQLKKLNVLKICGVIVNDWLDDKYNNSLMYYLSLNSFCSVGDKETSIRSLTHKGIDFFAQVVIPTHIGSLGTELLCNFLKCGPHLTNLNLAKNAMGSDGVFALCKVLHHVPLLQILCLENNYIGQDGMIALIKSFHLIPKLCEMYIGIGNDPIQAVCADLFFKNLVHLPELNTLDMPGVEVAEEECDEMPLLRECLLARSIHAPFAKISSTFTILGQNAIQQIIGLVKSFT